MKDLTVLDNIIIGRVEPHIYAFTTNTIPNCLKVGDTYRPVSIRLKEWKDHYPQLKKQFECTAKVSEDTYFRDYSVHKFLEEKRHKVRLLPTDLSAGIYYSKEFFRDTEAADVKEAIDDISRDYSENTQEYQYYNAQSHLPETLTYARTESYSPRPNQQDAIDNFNKAIAAGRTNLLMYAVMRFGKSFTSMCCAVEMNARLVVVVSAKGDVLKEWQKTVQSHIKFEEYEFLTSKKLEENNSAVTDILNTGKRAVVFLTLQDLQGERIKDRHKEIFGENIDLLLIDETHFGARAEKYGEVLKSNNYVKDVKNKRDSDDYVEIAEAERELKVLSAKVRIHLSGTPYRILMRSEFKKEDIIAFCQFTDIVQAQEDWDKKYVLDDAYREWDNPYYGFPQMVRFAFNPNESSRKRLEELKKNGTTYAFSVLLKPQSVKKDVAGKHKKFVYEQEILDLLEVIDGSKDDAELLGFLDYDKIKDGKMCRHIVMVLPYCASCDAMEALIKTNEHRFRNLGEDKYEIINISGVDNPNKYKSPDDIKAAIRRCEENDKKTITLTVNRMLTGSTVEYWDTMLFLKDTASPQEYDQAIFRLQNPYIKTYVDDGGNTIKYNMKPQTLLVDFSPDRMFVMQEQKSMIYNVNVDEAGNSKLEERLKEELRISPIVVLNEDKIIEVNATDILQKISDYQKDKGIKEEALEIPADLSIIDIPTLKTVMENQNEIGSSAGFSVPAHESKGDEDEGELNVPDAETPNGGAVDDGNPTNPDEQKSEDNSLRKKIQSYYTRILLFAFITNDRVKSIADILCVYDKPDNTRIAQHLGLDKTVLTLLSENINKFILSKLDYKIQDLNDLSLATDMPPSERAQIAVSKFGKIGPANVITPSSICNEMVALLSEDSLKDIGSLGNKLLDIAGTSGEFAVALYDRLSALGVNKQVTADAIYTIPKSPICYELTRKLYEMLGLNTDNIATFYAEQMIEVKDGSGKVDYDKLVSLITQQKPFNKSRYAYKL
ncbi:MAG: DEAD/DEAH box helicase family protein [Muribaculaceae bacterium]|nr:DEAD/DEAH box helicase family protein [Muribaculaceae bacterium]